MLTSPWLASAAMAAGEEQKPAAAGRTADIHVHLFGVGDSNSGCSLSKKITDGPVFKLLTAKLKSWQKQLGENPPATLDETYVQVLAGLLAGSGLDKGAILAQDAAYDRRGKPDWQRTHFYIPNRYLFEVVAKHPKLMAPCVSINPDREDALAELKWCADRGARLLKIHPPTQGVDISDKRHAEFFRDWRGGRSWSWSTRGTNTAHRRSTSTWPTRAAWNWRSTRVARWWRATAARAGRPTSPTCSPRSSTCSSSTRTCGATRRFSAPSGGRSMPAGCENTRGARPVGPRQRLPVPLFPAGLRRHHRPGRGGPPARHQEPAATRPRPERSLGLRPRQRRTGVPAGDGRSSAA